MQATQSHSFFHVGNPLAVRMSILHSTHTCENCQVSGTTLDIWVKAVNTTDQIPALVVITPSEGGTHEHKTNLHTHLITKDVQGHQDKVR